MGITGMIFAYTFVTPRAWNSLVLLAFLLASCSSQVQAQRSAVPVTAGVKVTGNTTFQPGVYKLTDSGGGIVQITGSGFTVDFKGAKIVGPGTGKGIGLHITDARNVIIKNADVSGCLWGIVIERSTGVKLLDCVSSR